MFRKSKHEKLIIWLVIIVQAVSLAEDPVYVSLKPQMKLILFINFRSNTLIFDKIFDF